MIKGIIFDLDDTLYDATACYKKGMEQIAVFSKERFAIEREEFDINFAKARDEIKLQLGDVAASHNRLLYIQRFLESVGVSPVPYALTMYEIYWNTVLNHMKLYDYVIPLFDWLKEREIKIAVLSDLTAHIQYRKIVQLGIDSYINMVVTSEEAGVEKPAKEMFDLIMKKSLLSADELIMVGDSMEWDVSGARALGIQGIHYHNGVDIIREVRNLI